MNFFFNMENGKLKAPALFLILFLLSILGIIFG